METIEKAIPFITNIDGDFIVTEESKKFLRTLSGKKIGVICVVGKYRTGKSYFINKVILDRQNDKGFNVGPTINPCTKGLWIWNKTLKKTLKSGEEVDIIVMDCEGFGGMDENSNHDTRIFLFAILLSSYFIYNSLGTIDENALQTLSLIINLAKDIKSKASSSNNIAADQGAPENFPSFLWVLRDFSLKMVDERGDQITPKMYLENALANQKGCSEAIDKKNRTRRLLRHFFQERDCITMVRPVEIEDELQKLDTIPEKYLRKEFVDQMNLARMKVKKKVRVKKLNNKSITGEMFLHLAKAYTEMVNGGKVPNIENAWNYICKEKVEEAAENALVDLDKIFNSEEVQKMISDEEDWKGFVKKTLIKTFKTNDFGNEELMNQKLELLDEEIEKKMKKLEEGLKYGQEKEAKKSLKLKFQPLMDMVNQEKISDMAEVERMINQIKEEFEAEHDSINPKVLRTLFNDFKQEKQPFIYSSVMRASERVRKEKTYKTEAEIEKLKTQNTHLKDTYETQIENLREKLQSSEQRRYQLEAQVDSFKSKIENIEEKYQFEQEMIIEKQKNIKSEFTGKNIELEKELQDLKKKYRELELSETEHRQARVKYEQMCIQEKELAQKKFEIYENEIQNLRSNLKNMERENEKLNEKCKKIENSKEIEQLRDEVEELRSKKRNQDSQLGNLRMEKQYLDSKIQFLNAQIEEGKKIHETLLTALQSQLNNEENNSTNQLFMTNKNLVETLTKAESKIKKLEGKISKYKLYKRLIQSISAVQLRNNSKIIPIKLAMQMVQGQSDISIGSPYTLKDETLGANFDILDEKTQNRGVSASIVHTLVKEDPESSKVYTEYIIELKDESNDKKWNITRKYKDFVELHHNLMNKFPNVEFPSSTNQILGFTPSITAWMSNKRRTVIEDRRKALEIYLNEILQISEIQNSEILRRFLDVEESYEDDEKSQTTTNNYRAFYNNVSNFGEKSMKSLKENQRHIKSSKLFGKFDFTKFSENGKYFMKEKKSNRNETSELLGKSGEKMRKRDDSNSYKFRSGKPLQKYGNINSPYY